DERRDNRPPHPDPLPGGEREKSPYFGGFCCFHGSFTIGKGWNLTLTSLPPAARHSCETGRNLASTAWRRAPERALWRRHGFRETVGTRHRRERRRAACRAVGRAVVGRSGHAGRRRPPSRERLELRPA